MSGNPYAAHLCRYFQSMLRSVFKTCRNASITSEWYAFTLPYRLSSTSLISYSTFANHNAISLGTRFHRSFVASQLVTLGYFPAASSMAYFPGEVPSAFLNIVIKAVTDS